jgi:hypothetical protein
MSGEVEFAVAAATSEDGEGWYWHLTFTANECQIGPFASEEQATKDALETITGRTVVTAVDGQRPVAGSAGGLSGR